MGCSTRLFWWIRWRRRESLVEVSPGESLWRVSLLLRNTLLEVRLTLSCYFHPFPLWQAPYVEGAPRVSKFLEEIRNLLERRLWLTISLLFFFRTFRDVSFLLSNPAVVHIPFLPFLGATLAFSSATWNFLTGLLLTLFVSLLTFVVVLCMQSISWLLTAFKSDAEVIDWD